MVRAELHPREVERLIALHSLGVLDSESDPAFDALTTLAARLCDTPTALVSLVDAERQWFKSRVGMDVPETPRDHAVCAHAILGVDTLVVPDTSKDSRFADNPICGPVGDVQFYAGVPLIPEDGLPLGTLCVIDHKPRPGGLTERQHEDLKLLASQALKLLELERALAVQKMSLRESVHRTKNVIAIASAIASRTLGHARSVDEARQSLSDRLEALSKAQGFLLQASGNGAQVRGLVREQLTAFSSDDDPRFELEGGDAAITGEAAEGIGFALHELATNAVKHGALSVPEGRVRIAWQHADDGSLGITWTETGGPTPAPREPGGDGFGMVVVGALASQKIGGQATFDLTPEGACWKARIGPAHVVAVT